MYYDELKELQLSVFHIFKHWEIHKIENDNDMKKFAGGKGWVYTAGEEMM